MLRTLERYVDHVKVISIVKNTVISHDNTAAKAGILLDARGRTGIPRDVAENAVILQSAAENAGK